MVVRAFCSLNGMAHQRLARPAQPLERPLIVECSGKQVQRLTAETALTRVQGELNKIRAYEDGRKEREGEYKARMDEEHRCMYGSTML